MPLVISPIGLTVVLRFLMDYSGCVLGRGRVQVVFSPLAASYLAAISFQRDASMSSTVWSILPHSHISPPTAAYPTTNSYRLTQNHRRRSPSGPHHQSKSTYSCYLCHLASSHQRCQHPARLPQTGADPWHRARAKNAQLVDLARQP